MLDIYAHDAGLTRTDGHSSVAFDDCIILPEACGLIRAAISHETIA